MAYATVEALREEGVTEAMASDARLVRLLEEATAEIDRLTGWFFEPRQQRYILHGRGTPTLELPAPPIRLDLLLVGGALVPLSELVMWGAPVMPGFEVGALFRRTSMFPKGRGNIEVEGLFGFTEPDGSPEGRTPLAIRRACMLLVLRWLFPMNSPDAQDARYRERLIEERTRDQSYKLDSAASTPSITGDPEVDAILLRYLRPRPMGAV